MKKSSYSTGKLCVGITNYTRAQKSIFRLVLNLISYSHSVNHLINISMVSGQLLQHLRVISKDFIETITISHLENFGILSQGNKEGRDS